MRKIILILSIICFVAQPSFAIVEKVSINKWFKAKEERAISKVLKSQVKYANKTDFDKFISTYDPQYINGDGFNLDIYSKLVKDIWETYDGIKYGIKIQNIDIDGNKAKVELLENAYAEIKLSKVYEGELRSNSVAVYSLEKKNGKWRVISDNVLDETTSMLYGDAKGLEVKLIVPEEIPANTDYTASLEFTPPKETIAIASIASDKVEYPQKPTQEVFRTLPEDNILERILTSNNDNVDEYVVASIGLTKTQISDLNMKLSLTGFGYAIKRVNVNHDDVIKDESVK